MERETLEEYLTAGLSLSEIGKRVGLDRSTIGKMAKRYGLKPAGQSRYAPKPIEREALVAKVGAEATVAEIAGHFGVSVTTALRHLHRHGLRTAHSKRRRERRVAASNGDGTLSLVCRRHGRTRFQRDPRGSYRCLRCRAEAVVRRRRKVKQVLVREAGGACRLCGYDRYVGALHFHHRDPSHKRFGLSHGGFTMSLERLRAEAVKCMLLCSNCHAEVEGGMVELPDA